MSTEVRWRRGTAAQNGAFTGALAEVTVNTDKKALHVHDGSTAGGNRTLMLSELGAASGVASLDGSGKVPSAQLPPLTISDGSVTAPKLYADVAVRLMEFDIRDSRFAGGAKWDDSTDDTAAIAAFITYCQSLGGLDQYQGKNAARLHLPRGVGRISNLDVTSATNIQFVGEGAGVTTIRNVGNNPTFKSTNVAGTNDAFRMGFEGFTIYGPGRANANAHGFDLGALNNGFIKDVGIFACRDGIRLRNNWQTDITRLKMDGGQTVGGALTCYRGLCLLDGPGSVIENAVKVYGGIISGCELYGVRGESVTGSAFFGLEVLACGSTGVYLGDNPSGKDLKWFTWSGGLIDTCGDLLVCNRGGASYGGQIHFSGLWMGYANAGAGQGDAITLNNIQDATFRPDVVFNSDTALVANSCTGVTFDAGVIQGFDRSSVGAVPIQLANSTYMRVRAGKMTKTSGSPSTIDLAETGTSDYNDVDIGGLGSMTIVGANTRARSSYGFKTKNFGTAVIASGTSSIVVTHGLGRTPTRGQINVVPHDLLTAAGVSVFAVTAMTSTTFTITVNANVTAGLGFDWSADVSRG